MWVRSRRMRVHLAHRRVFGHRKNRGGVGARHGVIRRGVLGDDYCQKQDFPKSLRLGFRVSYD